jgi:hypothetical protein
MDEAERCHGLRRSSIRPPVGEGAPKTLIDDIPAIVTRSRPGIAGRAPRSN